MKRTNKIKNGLSLRWNSRAWRLPTVALLFAALLGSAAMAQAHVWSFNLINAPSALDEESKTGEYIQLTGAGTFDPDQGTVEASGSATVFNAFDHPAPPLGATLKGTWHATGFVSFSPDAGSNTGHLGGTLKIKVHFDLALGAEQPNATLTVMEDGIDVTGFGPDHEEYFALPGGAALFHLHGNAEP